MESCSWPVDYGEAGPCNALQTIPATGVALVEEAAVEYLWRWTGQQFGQCEATIRPCRQECWGGRSTYGGNVDGRSPFYPELVGGRWLNIWCGSCGPDSC